MVKSKIIALVLACVAVLSVTCYAAVDPEAYWYQKDDGTYAYDQIAFDHDRAEDLIYRSGFNLNADNYYVYDYSTGNIVGYDYEAFTRDYNALLPPVEPSEPEDEPEILPEPSEPDFVPLEPVEPEDELLDCLEPIDTEITDPDGNLVVDISEESIAAIADAVAATRSILYDTGVFKGEKPYTCQFPDSYLNDYKYITIWARKTSSNSYYYLMMTDVEHQVYLNSSGAAKNLYVNGSSSYNCGSTRGNFEIDPTTWNYANYFETTTLDDCPAMDSSDAYLVWSNFDVYTSTGSLYQQSNLHVPVISFDTGFDDYIIPSQELTEFSLPNPSKAGYSFLGWYLDPDLTELYTSSYQFTSDTTLYAKWEEAPPMVSFHQAIFHGFDTLFSSEPFVYITALFALLVVIGSIKLLMYKNL